MYRGNRFLCGLLCLALAASANNSYGKNIQLTDKDKAVIVKSILLRENLLGRGLRVGEVRGIIYLSTENTSPALVPRIRKIRFALLDPNEKAEWPKFGFSLFEFSPFEVEGSKVKISLRDSWSNDPNQFSRTDYEFTKRSGEWVGRRIGGGGGDSRLPFRPRPDIKFEVQH